MSINQLDEETINQIAAGEVIERPASVVKELIENSIDAGADEIDIVVADGGRKKIVVEDNGSGMSQDNAKRSILRHTTSKIKDYNDLWNIMTMGFRGEALSSIASVSQMDIVTKAGSSASGSCIRVEGGRIENVKSVASNQGTKIIVNNLFFNVPARKKFLKSRNYEQKNITDVVIKYGLIYTNKSFVLRNEEGILVEKPKTNSIGENITSIYGLDVGRETFPLRGEKISGYVVKPTINRSSRDYISVYVNKRFIKSKIVEDAILDAMKTLIFHGRFPIAVLNLEIEPDRLDVNVHPSKKIIKFTDENDVYWRVYESVKGGMKDADLFTTSSVKPAVQETFFDSTKNLENSGNSPSPSYFKKKDDIQGQLVCEQKEDYNIGVNILGQVHKTYIIIETKEGYSVIDQHAAEERVNYEKFKEQFTRGGIEKQELLGGFTIDLTAAEYSLLIENTEKLEQLGFGIEDFGQNCINVRKIPSSLDSDFELKDTLLSIVQNNFFDKKEEALKYMSCRASVKAGEELNNKQMRDLVNKLFKANNKYTCPHGRPTMLRYPLSKLEKDFKRVA
ncbi:MAG: DNA mismatch repair endonuclease MutL [Nanobdellota archaeon]